MFDFTYLMPCLPFLKIFPKNFLLFVPHLQMLHPKTAWNFCLQNNMGLLLFAHYIPHHNIDYNYIRRQDYMC